MRKLMKFLLYIVCILVLIIIGAIAQFHIMMHDSYEIKDYSELENPERVLISISKSEPAPENEQKYIDSITPFIRYKVKRYGNVIPVILYADPDCTFKKIHLVLNNIMSSGIYRVAIPNGDEIVWLDLPSIYGRVPSHYLTVLGNGDYLLDKAPLKIEQLKKILNTILAKEEDHNIRVYIKNEALYKDLTILFKVNTDAKNLRLSLGYE